MLKLIIEDDEGRKTVVPFVRDEITIGRQEGNTIRLTERNVSRRHARLLRNNGQVLVEDLGSYNGIRVNGEKIAGRAEVSDGDLIQIGDYDLAVQHEGAVQPAPHPPAVPAEHHPAPHPARATAAPATQEPPTEVAPVFADAEPVPADEVTSPDRAAQEHARRQSTSVIRVDQVEATRKREVRELDPDEAPRLIVLNSDLAGREFACIRTELRIGRTDDNDISLDHRSLSRTHAKLVREDNGEWRLIDLQSANGLTVNGEPYAQATLNHLDTIELGHLKLKFVGAGEPYKFVPGGEDTPAKVAPAKARSSKAPLIAGLTIVLLLGGAAAAYYFLVMVPAGGKLFPPEEPKVVEASAPKAEVAEPPLPAALSEAATEELKQPDDAAATVAPEVKEKLEAARTAMAAREFARAIALLAEARALPDLPQGVSAELNDLLDQARAEQMLGMRLDDAEKALSKGRLEEAAGLLDQAAATEAFQERHKALAGQLEKKQQDERARAQLASAKKTEPKPERTAPPPKETKPKAGEEAQRLYEDGVVLLKKNQHREAKTLFTRCLEADPDNAKCHLMLGSTYARLRDFEQGAKHYEQFLRLAPDAAEAPRVRTMLDEYNSKKGSN